MPSLPPPIWAELSYSGTWNDISKDVRATHKLTVTRGLSSESSSVAEPTSAECVLDSRDYKYAPRAPMSELFGKIGRNTPFRFGYTVGSPWVALPGTAGSKLTTPDAAQLAVTDLDLRIDVALEDWSQTCELAGRYVTAGENRSWALLMAADGQASFYWSPNGTLASRITHFSTTSVRGYNGQRMALRVTLDVNNGAGGYELRFYTGRTVDDQEWNLLGDPIVGAATTSIHDGTAGIELGEIADLADNPMNGKLFAFKLLNGINGTTAARMTASDAAPGATSFTSHGLTWTKAGAATLTNKHVRMAGEVPAWPPTRDLSGNDNYVSINPTGISRRIAAGTKPEESALLRYIKARGPIECWPLTDGPRTRGARSLVGGQDLKQDILIGEDTAAAWQQGSLAEWIEPVLSVKANTTGHLRGNVPRSASAASYWSMDLFLSGGGKPSSGQWTISDRGLGTNADTRNSVLIIFSGNLDQLTVVQESYGETTSSSSLLANIPLAGVYDEEPHHLRLTIDPGVSTTDWYVFIDGVLRGNGTIATVAMKAARTMLLGWGYATIPDTTMTDRSFGYITYWDSTGPNAADMYRAYLGFPGERAGTRMERLGDEAGYAVSVAGEAVYQQPMGTQSRKTTLELLNEANKTNFGYLLDARDRNELIHRGNSTLWNQPPALTLDFSAGLISAPFRPVDDDKLTENDVSVSREFGASPVRQVLDEGELSVQDFPDGVGRYDQEYTYSLETDAQAGHIAHMRVHLGTYNGVRYTRITLDLANERVHAMIDDILRIDVGDKIRLTNLPDDHGPDDVDVLVAGYTEEAGPDAWRITFNCVPGEPWTAGVIDSSTYGTVDTGGCVLTSAVTATATSVPVTSAGIPWVDSATYPGDFPFDVRTGGEVMRVTACTGTSANQTFTVVRSINGVTRSHAAGQDIRLASPVYIAL